MLCNVTIFNTVDNGWYFRIAAAMDGHAPQLMNLGTHLNANPIICKTTE